MMYDRGCDDDDDDHYDHGDNNGAYKTMTKNRTSDYC